MKRKKIMVSNIISWSLSGICIVLIAAAFLLITRSDRIRAEEAKGGDVGRISPVVSYGFDTGPSGFRTFGETADYKLEADTTTGELAFTVKKTGAVWYSNPPNREEDTKAPIKSRLDSQLIVFFMNTAATTVAVPMPDDTSAQSVKGGALKHREIDNGIEFTYGFPKFGTEIVLQVFINGEGLVARIPAGGVRELWPDNYVVTTITLLPFFGCENGVEDGYTLLPDGSGALMRFDNNRERFNIYSTEIYGPNLGTPKKGNDNSFVYDNNVDKEQAYMPVFGMKKNDDAFLAVITGGDDNVSVDALTSMKFSFYNQVYANFNYRQFEFITRTGLGAATNNGGSTVISDYSPALLAGRDIEVTYLFLDGSDANYVGMARRYNEYLTDKGLINTGSDIAKRPFVLDIWGAVRMNKYIWGINREVVEPLTKYRDVITLVRELKARGVDDIVINYIGALAGGVRGKIPLTMQTEGILGSRRDFLDMCEYLDQEGVTLFLEYDPVNLYKGGSGFSMNTNATRTFFDKLAYRYEFNPVTYEPDPKRRSLLLRPTDIPALTSKFFKSATDFGIENITMNDIGRMLYSDFNKNAAVTRSDVRDIFTGVLAEADGAFDRLMVKSGNAFTWAYADILTDSPITDNGYDMTDEAVPFYGLTLNGSIPMTTTSINFSEDYIKKFLSAAEMGCGLKYTWIYTDISILVDTDYNHLLSAGYYFWFDTAISQYKKMQDITEKIGDAVMVERTRLARDIYAIRYSNGRAMYVNYNDVPYRSGEINVPAKDLIIK